jgi:hypothetical protein
MFDRMLANPRMWSGADTQSAKGLNMGFTKGVTKHDLGRDHLTDVGQAF